MIDAQMLDDERFVGRMVELHRLQEISEQLMEGCGGMVMISGESGFGKSTLIAHYKSEWVDGQNQRATQSAREHSNPDSSGPNTLAQGVLTPIQPFVLWFGVASTPGDRNNPYGPLRKLIELIIYGNSHDWAGFKWYGQRLPPHVVSALEEAYQDAVELKNKIESHDKSTLSGSYDITLIFTVMLKRLAQVTPLIFFIDDLQDCDTSTLDYLTLLVKNVISDRPILILCTYRPDLPEDTEEYKKKHKLINPLRDHVVEIILSGFDIEESLRYIDVTCHPNILPPGAKNQLYELSEGSPLRLYRIINDLKASKTLVRVDGVWTLVRDFTADEILTKFPSAIHQRLEAAREDRDHHIDLKGIIDRASIQGEVFNTLLLKRLYDDDQVQASALDEGLEVLEYTHQFFMQRDTTQSIVKLLYGGSDYHFDRSITRKLVYMAIPNGRRVELHGRTGEILESLASDEHRKERPHIDRALAELIAFHYTRGERFGKAAEYTLMMARDAQRLAAKNECEILCNTVLDLLNKSEKQETCGILPDQLTQYRAEALLLKGQTCKLKDAIPLYESALALSTKYGTRIVECLAHRHLADALREDGHNNFQRAEEHLKLALAIAKELDDLTEEIRIQRSIGTLQMFSFDWSGANLTLNACLESAKKLQNNNVEAELRCEIAELLYRYGMTEEAIEQDRRAVELANSLRATNVHMSEIAQALVCPRLAYIYILMGEWSKGKQYLELAAPLIDRYEYTQARGDMMQGWVQYYLGQGLYTEAFHSLEMFEQFAEGADFKDGISYVQRWRGHLYILQNRLDEAEREVNKGNEYIPLDARDPMGDLGLIKLYRGQLDDALDLHC